MTIAFAGPCCSSSKGTIWSLRADGSGAAQLTPPTQLLQQNPRFSPQGDRIVFQSTGPNFDHASILAMDPNGNGLTTIQADAYFPDWGVAP
jgi:Tol biopolymer transport system component